MRSRYSSLRGLCRLPSYYSKGGYTILEVLIAVAIFSAMVTMSTMALNQGLKQYHNLIEKGINFWDNAKHLWINKSLASAVDYYVYSKDAGWFPYFKGDQELISYVSLSPLTGNEPVLAWIRNERMNDGSRSLVYYELPVYSMGINDIERQYAFGDFKKGKSIILLKEIQDVEIRFYGYEIRNAKWVWTGDFDGKKRRVLPEIIRVDYRKKDDKEKRTLILGVNTNSMIKTIYNEIYYE